MPQKPTPTDPSQGATTVKKPGHYRNQCRLLKKQKQRSERTQNFSWEQER